MQVGDPRKASVLAIVALMVVGVAAFRIVPRGATSLAPAPPSNMAGDADSAETPPPVGRPILLTDPFVHPKLNEQEQVAGPEVGETRQVGGVSVQVPTAATRTKKPPTPESEIRPVDPHAVGAPISVGEPPSTLPSPLPGDISDRQSDRKDGTLQIRLVAVVRVESSEALVSINGGPNLRTRSGTRFGPTRIVAITEDAIVVVRQGKRTQVRVGEEATL